MRGEEGRGEGEGDIDIDTSTTFHSRYHIPLKNGGGEAGKPWFCFSFFPFVCCYRWMVEEGGKEGFLAVFYVVVVIDVGTLWGVG